MNETCQSCRFGVNPGEKVGGEPGVRLCQRFPPTVTVKDGRAVWPYVLNGDWCGEYVKG